MTLRQHALLSRLEESEKTLESAQFPEQTFDLPRRKNSKQNPPETQLGSTQVSETTVAMNSGVEVADMQQLSDQLNSMMEIGEKQVQVMIGNGKIMKQTTRICKVCGKEGRHNDIKRHVEANHITAISHTCDICGNKAKTRESLRVHKLRYHRKDL